MTNQNISKAIEERIWSIYDSCTTSLSSICRQLAFAEGGVCWFFISQPNHCGFSHKTQSVLLFLILFFICDALQYLLSSIIYFVVGLYLENKNDKGLLKKADEIQREGWMNFIPEILFPIKLLLLSIASYFLIKILLALEL